MIPFTEQIQNWRQLLPAAKEKLIREMVPGDVLKKIEAAPLQLNSAGIDPWGLSPETAKTALALVYWLYRYYFRVEVTGVENLPPGRLLVVGNHGGQLPLDGLLLGLSLLVDANPPRIARGMVERWVPAVPFLNTWFTRIGQIVGDPKNCRDLLLQEECVMVFPEGVRGSGKSIFSRYRLQRFGTGFLRLALETQSPIVPAAIIGAEEAYPGIAKIKWLARLFKTPYFPITPFFPLLGPLGAMPLPTKITIRFGKPHSFEGNPDAPDSELMPMVEQIKRSMQSELNEGLRKRGKNIFTGAAK